MPRNNSLYICESCGVTSTTWAGKCFSCGDWNTLRQEEQITKNKTSAKGRKLISQTVKNANKNAEKRIVTQIPEVDTVLGGGLVAGSINLVTGQPGVGKSTLLLQLAYKIAKNHPILYVSGEESVHQIGMRAKRLGVEHDNLHLATSDSANDIATTIASKDYKVVIVDSIQTVSCEEISSSQGSISQITNSTHLLSTAAKQTNTALLLVGHVTKEGSIAGPKLLEHIVDVVLQLEGEKYGGFKVLRGEKNRFGSTNEVGIFEMTEEGLKSVDNPSAALLAERQITDGSIVLATIEGSRPILVEVQALVNKTGFGYPKRAASGIDYNRLNLLIAMLERRTKLKLDDKDVYINVVGGLKIAEPAADLAICMAIASATKGMQLKKNSAVFGEVGLSGEIRHVPFVEKRLSEAKKLGLDGAIGPKLKNSKINNYLGVSDIRSALNTFLEK